MKDLAEYFTELGKKEKQALVLGHPHADPDAVGSVMVLEEILETLGMKVIAGIPSNLSRLSKSVLESVDREITVDPQAKADLVIILDTSSLGQLKEYKEKIENLDPEIVFIDHHRPDKKTQKKADRYYVREESSSTVELILELGQELDFDFTSKISTIMLTGIISDTGHFRFANDETFRAVTTLLNYGASYKGALEALKTPEDPSKRVAMLKAAQRSENYKSHGRWIAYSEIGAYESDAASMLVKIGADASIVANSEDGRTKISGRSRSGVASETRLHLGELMSNLADDFDGTGGGHAGAAAMRAEADLEEVKEKALKELKDMLEPKANK